MHAMDLLDREAAFGSYLLERALLSEALLRQAQEVAADTDSPLVRSLTKLGFIPESRLADALADFFQFSRLSGPIKIAEELHGLSIDFLQYQGIAPIEVAPE